MIWPILLLNMQITHISTAVPTQEYTTEELLEMFPCDLPEGVRRNVLNMGVSKRCLIDHELTRSKPYGTKEIHLVDLCTQSCRNVLEDADLEARDIGHFIVTYDANPVLSPGLSQLLTRKLGFGPYARRVNVQGEASTAFPKGLQIAGDYLSAHPRGKVLLCVSGVNSYWFSNQIRAIQNVFEIDQINVMKNGLEKQVRLRGWIAAMQFFLFGDGVASLMLSRNGQGISVGRIVEVTNLRQRDRFAGYARLTSLEEPFKFGFYSCLDRKIPELGLKYSSAVLRKLLGKKVKDAATAAKKWAIHTGSEKILNKMAEHHRIVPEALKESHEILNEYGNLGGASLPFILKKIVSNGTISRGDKILMLAYGWGFAASAGLLEFDETRVP